MVEDKRTEIIKGAMLLELKGKAFYDLVASSAKSDDVCRMFEIMAGEEEKHLTILQDTYKKLLRENKFTPGGLDDFPFDISTVVLSENIRNQISAAGFEAAAISAAIAMEDQAIRFYSNRADEADDPKEKQLYEWLADWERTHLDFLARVDQELKENIWFDQKFWPSV